MQPLTGSGSLIDQQEETREVTRALVMGAAVMALCGKVWVPHRDPNKYPVCPTCKEIYESIDE